MKIAVSAAIVLAGAILAFAEGGARPAVGQQPVPGKPLKIGVMNDMSGPFSDWAGKGSLEAVRLAVEDFGGKIGGLPIEIVSADHQNKPDIGVSIARAWYDREEVDAILDISNSTVALAVLPVAVEKNKIVILGAVSTPRVTTSSCTPNSIQYVYDSNALSNTVGKAIVRRGGKSWFFITADNVFGTDLQRATTSVITDAGGSVVGSVRYPSGTSDFSSFLLQAQSSHAEIVALVTGGADTINAIKVAAEFGLSLSGKQKVLALINFITDIHGIGLKTAQDLLISTPYYWDHDEGSRQFAKKFFARTGKMPTMIQAGMYSAAMFYLKSVAAVGTSEAKQVMARMKSVRIDDFYSRGGRIRPDGLHVHEMLLMKVKKPEDSKRPWDYYETVTSISPDEAFSPMVEGACAGLK